MSYNNIITIKLHFELVTCEVGNLHICCLATPFVVSRLESLKTFKRGGLEIHTNLAMFHFTPLLGAQSDSPACQSLLELDNGIKILVDVGWDETFDVGMLAELERLVILWASLINGEAMGENRKKL